MRRLAKDRPDLHAQGYRLKRYPSHPYLPDLRVLRGQPGPDLARIRPEQFTDHVQAPVLAPPEREGRPPDVGLPREAQIAQGLGQHGLQELGFRDRRRRRDRPRDRARGVGSALPWPGGRAPGATSWPDEKARTGHRVFST
jgi:hypothetical protein